MISNNLGKIAVKGAAYLTVLTFAKKFLGIIRNIILARLLAPEDFGLLALALVLIEGMGSLTFIGIDNYLIQKKKISNNLVCNAWFLNIIRGLLLTLLSLAVCPFYSKLVNEPATLEVLWIIAFNPLLEGIKNPSSILAERQVRFEKISIYETLCAFLEVAVVVVIAWFIRDAEALAWGVLFGTLLKTLLSFFFFPILGLPRFDLTCQIELLSVAKHFVVITAGTFIMAQGDNLIVGAIEGSTSLGIYVIAYQLAVFPVLFLQDIANRVAMPVFSSLQVDKERLRCVLADVLQIQFFVIIPFVIVTVFFADEFVTALYGDGWTQSGGILRFLMVVTLGKGLTHVCVPYILGTGSFSFASRMKCFETIFFLGSVYIGTRYFGVVGAALGAGMGYMVAGIGRLIFICRDAYLNFFSVVYQIVPPVFAVLPGILIGMLLTDAVTWHRTVETGIILVSVCIGYAGLSFFVQRKLIVTLLRVVFRSRLSSK